MRKLKYNILFGLLFLGLIIHFAFSPLNIIKDLPLNGYYEKPSSIEFSLKNYFTGIYQDSTDKYLKYQFGLFPGFTRIHHQLEYSLFRRIYVQDVYKGENGYLFRYCKGCLTNNKFAPEKLNRFLERYLILKDSLKNAGKNIIWIVAPDKNLIYSEYLSRDESHPTEIIGYYWDFKKNCKQKNIPFLDFNELAYREKYKYPFAISNKGGVHWTQAYAARCFDSLCNYLSYTSSISVKNKIRYKKTNNPWSPDFDIEKSANLLIPLEKKNNFYVADIISTSNVKNKKILLIGDSFCHAWMWNKWFKSCFHPESEFWYYNREATKMDNTFIKNLDHKNVRNYTGKFDIFILAFSAGNMEMLDYGFIDDLYK